MVSVISLFLAGLLIITSTAAEPVLFPPEDGTSGGGYVLITQPGKYTLEHPVTHQYPAGIIIASPSVILDGQGYAIRPSQPGSSVGIWISLTDPAGRPVTGVTIRNISIEGEECGIFLEGTDSTRFPWGRDRSADPEAATAARQSRGFTLSGITITGCVDGIIADGTTGVRISDSEVTNGSGSGIILEDGQAQVIRSLISGHAGDGIFCSGGSGSEISSSRISGNRQAGIHLEKTGGITIWDSILDNTRNLQAGPDSTGVVLAVRRSDGENAIGGVVIGGNFWADGSGSPLAAPDLDGDGIADAPYEPVPGFADPLPLVRAGEPPSPGILTLNTAVTPAPVQDPVPAPVQTPASFMTGIHAVIISDTIPAEMTTGTSYPVSIDLYNDGSDDWIPRHRIGVMALEETGTYGPEWIPVPISGSVSPGKTQSVRFTLRSPSRPGTYSLQYQAAREGDGLQVIYGRPYTRTVTVR